MRLQAKKSRARLPDRSLAGLTSVGQAMFFALFILAVFGALSAGLAVMWESEMRTRASDRDGLIAFYLAQAGIEEAKIWARNNPGSDITSAWSTLGGGRYRYAVVGATRDLSSTGQALDTSNSVIAERQIATQVNAAYTAQSGWSWREQ